MNKLQRFIFSEMVIWRCIKFLANLMPNILVFSKLLLLKNDLVDLGRRSVIT